MRVLKPLLIPLKELDNLLIAAAAVLGIVGIFVDETIRAIAPLVGVVGVVVFAAHLVRQARQRGAAATVGGEAPERQRLRG